jgi:hypothetical protein
MRSARRRIAGHVAIIVATVVLTALSIWLGWGPVVLSP